MKWCRACGAIWFKRDTCPFCNYLNSLDQSIHPTILNLLRKEVGEERMRAILTPDDLKKGDLAEVGWHPMEIVDYEEKDAETDGSTNCIFKFKIIDGPNKGVSPTRLFNEKALGFGKALWAVLFGPPDPVKGYDTQLTTESFKAQIGKKVMGYIKRGKSNKGNEFNDVVDFRPMS